MFGIPKLFVKFWWPLFFALNIRLFLAKIHIAIPKCSEEGGVHRLKRNNLIFTASLMVGGDSL